VKKLYVCNLPHQATEAELEAWFLRAGIRLDTINIVRDRFSGGPRGFGFVEIANDEEAARAIAECDGRDFLGRKLAVNEAHPRREDRPARDMRRRR
jgi:RNA recognition motif-containing protein